MILAAGLADIIESKESTNRTKDHEALPELYAIMARRRKFKPPSP